MGTVIQPDGFKAKLRQVASLLLIPYTFILPMWIAPTYILGALIFVLWLSGGNVREDLARIRNNGLVWAIVAYVSLHVIGLLWSTEFQNTKAEVAPAALFLFVPVFMMVIKPEHRQAVLWAFLASMALSSILSFLIYFQLNPDVFKPNGEGDPIRFMSHIHYAVYLTAATAISLYLALFDTRTRTAGKFVAGILSIFYAAVVFISNGRAGQVMFIVMAVIFLAMYFRKRLVWAFAALLIGFPLLMATVYFTVQPFRQRVDGIVADVKQYDSNRSTSTGARVVYAMNGLTVFSEHPVIGVGTDDFALELKKAHMRNTPDIPFDVDVHNTYVMKMGQFGVLGLITLLGILYAQLRIAVRSSVPIQRYLGFAIPFMFAVVNLSDIYFQLHFTLMLFIWISAIVYGDEQTV